MIIIKTTNKKRSNTFGNDKIIWTFATYRLFRSMIDIDWWCIARRLLMYVSSPPPPRKGAHLLKMANCVRVKKVQWALKKVQGITCNESGKSGCIYMIVSILSFILKTYLHWIGWHNDISSVKLLNYVFNFKSLILIILKLKQTSLCTTKKQCVNGILHKITLTVSLNG